MNKINFWKIIILISAFGCIMLLFHSCNNSNNPTSSISNEIRDSVISYTIKSLYSYSVDSVIWYKNRKIKSYLPFELLGNYEYPELDTNSIFWYSGVLRNSKEPIMYNNQRNDIETYRFVCAPSFEFPKIFRLEKNNNKAVLISSTYTTDSILRIEDYRLDLNLYSDTQYLSTEKWMIFKNILDSMNFWHYKTFFTTNAFDGVGYYIEGRMKNKYRFIWMLNPNGDDYHCIESIFSFCTENSKIFNFEINFYFNFLKKSITEFKSKNTKLNLYKIESTANQLGMKINSFRYFKNKNSDFISNFYVWRDNLQNIYHKEIFKFIPHKILSDSILNKNIDKYREQQFEKADKKHLNEHLLKFDNLVEEFNKLKKLEESKNQ